MSRQNRLACLLFLLLAPGFLTTVYTQAYNSLHLEMFAFLGWGILATLGGLYLLKANHGLTVTSSAVFAGFTFVAPAVVILLQQAFGVSVPYFGMVAIAIYYLLVSACVCLLGSLAAAWVRNLPASSNAKTEISNGALTAFVGLAVASSLIGIAQYLQIPISETFVSPVVNVGVSYGNLRQPNLFALLCVLGLICLILLCESPDSVQGKSVWFFAIFFLLLLGIVLSTSRTGTLLVGIISLWGLVESWRANKPYWMPLLALPVYLLLRYIVIQLDLEGIITFYGAHRQGIINTAIEGDYWRQIIWLKSWTLIQAHPVWGVGFGNIAYAMFTESLPVALPPVTEHAHNIFLQLAVEFGLPMAAGWILVLAVLIVQSRSALKTFGGRATAMFLIAVLVHSLLEYPLWYAYFLLPFTFTLGVFIQIGTSARREKQFDQGNVKITKSENPNTFALPSKAIFFGGVLTILLAIFGLWDYSKVSPNYELNSSTPLHDRVILSYKSALFLNLADYSALNLTGISPATAAVQFRLASRVARFRFDSQVAAAHAAAASLTGQMTLGKASAYRLWLKDKEAAERLWLGLQGSGLPPALELAAFLANPVFIPWP